MATRPIARKDAFFGLHFDLHPQNTDTALGADITEGNLGHLLDRVRPDYVQYDCKGHAGYTGYPTKIGWASPGIVQDSLALWRKSTREHGVKLFIHYSGVWDTAAVEHHPDWGRVDEKGQVDRNAASTFGPYVDDLLIPQLKEVVSAYELDGMWVDGECWAVRLDYSPRALEAWKKETGLDVAPKGASEPHWLEWKDFNRRQFDRYLARWVDALHAFRPSLEITSNWMYTTFAPKRPEVKLDFISGDYTHEMSALRVRLEARYIASVGMPWDLMAWGFTKSKDLGWSWKTAIHLQQEAAVVLTQGGGFQIYYQPTRSGHIPEQIIETAGQVADFCRARQEVCHKSTTVPQVALLLSAESYWDKADLPYAPWRGEYNESNGALAALVESHYSVDVLTEYQLQPTLSQYPLVVIPNCHKLADDFRSALLAYVSNGGCLLLLGDKCAELFGQAAGVRPDGRPEDGHYYLDTSGGVVNQNGPWQKVSVTTARAVGHRYPSFDTRKAGQVAATIATHGKGRLAAVWGPIALNYSREHHPAARRFIGDLATELFPDRAAQIEAPAHVEVALRRTRGGLLSLHLLNLLNAPAGEQYGVIDFVPTVGPIPIKLRTAARPRRVRWLPDGTELKWEWNSPWLTTTVASLHIHGAVVVE